MGRVPGLASLGVMEDEAGADLELWAEDESAEKRVVKGDRAPPRQCTFLLFFFCFSFCSQLSSGDAGQ